MKNVEINIFGLLDAAGLLWGEVQEGRLARYLDEIREWNAYASLVSCGDLERLEMHVVDSLSLGPVIGKLGGGTVLDVGSGSGFPAIPLAILFSGAGETPSPAGTPPRNDKEGGGGELVRPVRFVLVERSEKKAAFLKQVTGVLGLDRMEVVLGEFPGVVKGRKVDIVTARAVERPEKVIKGIVSFVQGGANYLCQSGDPSGWLRGMFHVEPIVDAWSEAGFRRGSLHLVCRKT